MNFTTAFCNRNQFHGERFYSITLAKFLFLSSQSNPHNWVFWTLNLINNEDKIVRAEWKSTIPHGKLFLISV